jgi:hypothetical protein
VLDSKAKGLKKFAFTEKDLDEAKAFLKAEPAECVNDFETPSWFI